MMGGCSDTHGVYFGGRANRGFAGKVDATKKSLQVIDDRRLLLSRRLGELSGFGTKPRPGTTPRNLPAYGPEF